MIIAIDLLWMQLPNEGGGGFQYAERLVTALVRNSDNTYIAMMIEGQDAIFNHLREYKNFVIEIITSFRSFHRILKKHDIQLLYAPIQFYKYVTKTVPMVATLHDLQHYHYPDYFSQEEWRLRDNHYRNIALMSERVIVSFTHVKNDINKFYNIPNDKIDLCQIGYDVPVDLTKSKIFNIRDKYDIPVIYLFYSANTWPHKNHITLIKALKILHDLYHIQINLVCTGSQYEEQYKVIKKIILQYCLESYVFFLGYIPEEEKLILLNNAALVVIPTQYEAGSFPLMEAMNYGVPVICSNVTSLPDQIGDNRFIFNPDDAEEMASKMFYMLTDEKLRKENIANSLKISGEIRWEKP